MPSYLSTFRKEKNVETTKTRESQSKNEMPYGRTRMATLHDRICEAPLKQRKEYLILNVAPIESIIGSRYDQFRLEVTNMPCIEDIIRNRYGQFRLEAIKIPCLPETHCPSV